METVYHFLTTDTGRSKYWAKTRESENEIEFTFPNGLVWKAEKINCVENSLFSIKYLGGSIVTFTLEKDDGTDLSLIDIGVKPEDRCEVIAGWVSVLLSLKAAVDFDVDLRNHHPDRNWDLGYVDN
ncbi:MAG: hypothetical protein INQ03_12640 [Candidatus Heimdallarchaeota archaeon]|nr:hypothetical protein [Candidatus Heimdallarchaeota archaeon]